MEFQVLAGELNDRTSVLFAAAMVLVFAGALIEGFASLWIPRVEEEEASGTTTIAAGALLAAFIFAIGLYAGTVVDLLMREYGLPVSLPFSSWSSLGWAALLCAAIAALILYAWSYRGRGEGWQERTFPGGMLPLRPGGRLAPGRLKVPGSGKGLIAVILWDVMLYAAWAAVVIYLAFT
jgi:hypothetical protein